MSRGTYQVQQASSPDIQKVCYTGVNRGIPDPAMVLDREIVDLINININLYL